MQLEYASLIDILIYVNYTRLDNAFAVCKLSRDTSNPNKEYYAFIRFLVSRWLVIIIHHILNVRMSICVDNYSDVGVCD